LGRALAYSQTGILVGQTSGPAVGALLATFITRPHWLYLISGCVALTAGTLVAVFVREVKQLAPGPWRLQWIGPLRELLRGSRLGPIYLLAFLFAVMWSGNVAIMSLYTMQLLAGADNGHAANGVRLRGC